MIHDHEQQAEALTLHMQDNADARDQLRRIGGLWNDAAHPPPPLLENAQVAANGDGGMESDQEDVQVSSQSSNDEDSDATIPSNWQAVEGSSSPSQPEMHNQDQQVSGKW